MADHIKLWLGNETLWALPIAPGLAKLDNIPCDAPGYGYADLVKHEGGVITERVERCTRTVVVSYDPGEDEPTAKQRYRAIRIYFEPHGVVCQSYGPGLVGMAVPLDLKKSKFRRLVLRSPYQCFIEAVR